MQIELADDPRVWTRGVLTASTAHELSESLGAILINCDTSLRWLDGAKPDLSEVRTSMRRALADAHRAVEIVARLRRLATPSQTSSIRS
jgi:hypothetical protein